MTHPKKIAFPLLGRSVWTGGYVYLKNTLSLLSSRLPDKLKTYVFLSPEENEKYGAELSRLVTGAIISNRSVAMAGRGTGLAKALLLGRDTSLDELMQRHGIDVVFESASFYGRKFSLPVITWIPDLQHRYMPEMFGRFGWWRRDFGFRTQVNVKRQIMLSSFTAQSDLEKFYPKSVSNTHVVRFAIDLDIRKHLEMGGQMRDAYSLPDRFFFLPNQFWRHKNHNIIIAALALLKARGKLEDLLPIVLTGQPKDPRSPAHFDALQAAMRTAGVESHFRYLGLVPYDHVLALNATCERMINPSFFEGWSTPIEEAKAFATPLLLSDIPIHREQAPGSLFFDPHSAEAAANSLLAASQHKPDAKPKHNVLRAAQDIRLQSHADALLGVVESALRAKRKISQND
jgi:glycosyltransferase involved in cell wall biosynthesis